MGALDPSEILGTYIIKSVPSYDMLDEASKNYDNVVVFIDFNNFIKGIYYPEITEMIISNIVNNDLKIPSILIEEWIKFQTYIEKWALAKNKKLKCIYFSEHGKSFYHTNLNKNYKANRDSHRNITIPTGLMTYFDNDISKVNEILSGFLNSTWEWISKISSKCNVGTFRLSNLDADFIPEYLFRKVKNFYQDNSVYLIVSTDSDMIQLLDFGENVKILDYDKIITRDNWMVSKKYLEKYLSEIKEYRRPDRIILYKATVGDSADNISGIPRLGPKAFASHLINIPEDIDCDNILELENYFKSKSNENKIFKSIIDNIETFKTGLKLTSFKLLIDYLYATPTRNDLLMKAVDENISALSEGNVASMLDIVKEKNINII